MRSRLRASVALPALLAFSLFWVEGVMASTCAPGMEAASSAEMETAPDALDCPMGEPGHSHEQGEGEPRGPVCPLVPSGAVSCTGGVAVLAGYPQPVLDSPYGEGDAASPDHAKDLLLAVSLLRPPRA